MVSFDVDARACGSEGRYANHYKNIAAAANATYEIRTEAHSGTRWVELRATRRIAPGEEVLTDYGYSYWDVRARAMRLRVRDVA